MKAGVKTPYSIRVIITNAIFMCNLFLMIFILFFPQDVLNAARDGLVLWFNNVLPALLPFIVVVNLLTALGFVRLIGKWAAPLMKWAFGLPGAGGFAFITGLISGYPVGAKTVADLWRSKTITTLEAQRLLAFCNNAGPLFIVGVVGVGLMGDSRAGYVLWAGHIISAGIAGILINMGYTKHHPDKNTPNLKKMQYVDSVFEKKGTLIDFGKALGDAVKNATETLLLVGGLIVFFSVVVRAISIATGDLSFMAEGVIAGIVEVTGGVKILASIPAGIISPQQMAVIGGVIAFGGFSVHAQALHFTSRTGVRAGVYIVHKALGGIIAAGVTWLLWSLFAV